MTDYTKTTNFASKDSLPSGNANKIVKGTEIDTEFNNIATASATKADIASPTFTGTVTIPTADINGGAVDGTTIGASSASSIVGTTIVANTSINIAGDGATVTGIKDEDDMSSNSATKLATQQSIKAYVDSQVTAQDLDVTDGSSSIDIDLDSESLGILGGTGIDSTASGTGVTLAIDSTVATLTGSQTLTNKTLTAPTLTGTAVVASLDISGDVDVDGTLETDALSINGTTVTSTAAELNILDGVTSTAAELNILDGVTSTTAELNILDGVTSTAAELNILDGVTSTTAELNILDGVTATAAELNIMDGVTATTAELNIMDGVTSTTAELNILDGVTSTAAELNILDGKAFLDEDDMSSNSATGIASQQSIKAYVDSQVTAQDLDFQADSGGALSIDLDSETLTFTGGTGIDTSGSGNAVTFAIDSTVATLTGSQTLTNKTLTSPDINTPDIDGGTIDGTTIGGSTPAAGTFTTFTSNGIDDNADAIAITIDSSEKVKIGSAAGSEKLSVAGSITTDGYIYPTTDNGWSLGLSGNRWGSVFAQTADFENSVSIGTSSADTALHIQAADSDTANSASNGHITFADDGGTSYYKLRMGTTNRYFSLDGYDTDSAWKEIITFDRVDQNVGIGTNSPHSSGASFTVLNVNGTKGGSLAFSRGTNSATKQWAIRTSDDEDLRFEYGSTLASEAMRIDGSNGNVGIGDSPLTLTGNAAPGLTVSSNGPFILLKDANNANKVRYMSNNTGELQFGIVNDDGSTSKTEHMRIDSSGNVIVGTTSSGGDIDNSNKVVGGIHNTYSAAVSAANNTATTMVNLSSQMATYIACANFNGIGASNLYGASAIIHADGTSYTLTHLVNPSNMTLSMSGSNVQATHTAGATLNISFSVIRIQ